jgi:hypothetical protein
MGRHRLNGVQSGVESLRHTGEQRNIMVERLRTLNGVKVQADSTFTASRILALT